MPFYKTFYSAIFKNDDLIINSENEQNEEFNFSSNSNSKMQSISDTLRRSKLDFNDHMKCVQSPVSKALSNSIELKKSELYENSDSILMELDYHIQRINKEAAKLLK